MLKKIEKKIFIALFCFSISIVYSQNSLESQDERKQFHADWMANTTPDSKKHAFHTASAKFFQYQNGNTNKLEAALTDCDLGLEGIKRDPEDKDISFALWSAMDCYLRWNKYMPQSLKEKFKQTLTNTTGWSIHNTSNKDLMAATGRYLASLTWSSSSFKSNYKHNDHTGILKIESAIDDYVHKGEHEYNSPTYFMFHYGCLRTLADLLPTTDDIKQMAYVGAEWMLCTAVPEWLEGYWAAAKSRSTHNPSHPRLKLTPGSYMMWQYFGTGKPSLNSYHGAGAVVSAVSDYKAPDFLVDIANKKLSEGFVHKERRESYSLTSFKKPSYAAYSQIRDEQSNIPANELKYKNQSEHWGICWLGKSGNSLLTIKNPFKYDHIYASNPEWGTSQFQQILQSKGTILGVYNIPNSYSEKHIKMYIPDNYDAVIDNSSGKNIYLNYGSVLIALHLTRSFGWNKGITEYLVSGQKIGFVAEAVDADKYVGSPMEKLKAFKEEIEPLLNATVFTSGTNPKIEYINLEGKLIENQYNKIRKIDRQQVTLADTKLVNNPWMYQEYLGDKLTVNIDDKKIIYDLKNWVIQKNIPQESYTNQNNIPGDLECEHYDKGGLTVGHLDDFDKQGNINFRPDDFVDVGYKSNAENNYAVGWTENGEWLEYTLNNIQTGTYDVELRYSSGGDPGKLAIYLGEKQLGVFDDLRNTGSWNTFKLAKIKNVKINFYESKVLKLKIIGGGYDLDKISFELINHFPDPNVWYVLQNKDSKLNMRNENCATPSETKLELFDGTGECAQWRFEYKSDHIKIINRKTQLKIDTMDHI